MDARAVGSAGPLAIALALALFPCAAAVTEIADIEEGATAALVWSDLNHPVNIAFGQDGALYYAEFDTGLLRVIPPGAAGPSPDEIWRAPDLQTNSGEQGFVGMAVSPVADDTFYVYYQMNRTDKSVSRFSMIVDGAETVLIDDIRAGPLHNSGRIAFTPENKVLLAVGDATLDTIGRAASLHAHDPASLNGKVLRLELDGSIPDDNPWGNAVWTKGHRNVYGLAVSPAGVVLATENGPDHWDEVNILEAGNDYGWPTCSGACDDERYTNPVLAYESTIAPTGAAWHEGAFYFSDFNKGTLHRVRPGVDGAWLDERVLKFTTPRVIDVVSGPDGLYLSTWDSIWRVVPAPVPGAPTPTTPSTAPTTTIVSSGAPPTSGPPAPPTEDVVDGQARIPSPALLLWLAVLLGIPRFRGKGFK